MEKFRGDNFAETGNMEDVMALGHYMREKSAKSKGTYPARKHPRKRCEMPPRKHARESG